MSPRSRPNLTILLLAPAAILVLAATPAPAPTDATLADLAWLAGHWQAEHGGAITEELWTRPAGGLMLGLNRQYRAGEGAAFEYLRIEEGAEGIRYLASPGGGPPTAFPLARTAERHVVFENPDHDWPQVIEYRLDDEGVLHVRAAGLEAGSQELAWTMEETGGR